MRTDVVNVVMNDAVLLAVEIAGAVARVLDEAEQAILLSTALRRLPGQIWAWFNAGLQRE